MSYEGTESTNDCDISDYFRKFFVGVYQGETHFDEGAFDYLGQSEHRLDGIVFSLDDVRLTIAGLDVGKGAGPDLLPNKFLKHTCDAISRLLLPLFNFSLESGTFPRKWKHSYITPIHKSGSRSSIVNHTGVVGLSAISKLLEKMVLKHLYDSLSEVINPHQRGFGKGKSTVTNLADYTSFLRREVGHGKQVDAIYTNLAKAFDKVDHDILILKLSRLGISEQLLRWISSYLRERTQVVKFRNTISDIIHVTSSVPQGSHLGPLLFVIFINDWTNLMKGSRFLLYADDLKIFKVVENADDCEMLQKNVDVLSECEEVFKS